MKRVQQVVSVVQSVVLGAVMTSLYVLDKLYMTPALNDAGPAKRVALISALWLTLILLIYLIAHLIRSILEHWPWLRRWVFGSDFIEGKWLNAVRVTNEHPWQGGLLSFSYKDGHIRVHGDTFDESGKHLGSFESVATRLENQRLWFWYEKHVAAGNARETAGASRYIFAGEKRFPTRFNGWYMSPDDGSRRVIGRRLESNEVGRATNHKGQGELVARFVAEYKSSTPC